MEASTEDHSVNVVLDLAVGKADTALLGEELNDLRNAGCP
jgi:hypothetical protein